MRNSMEWPDQTDIRRNHYLLWPTQDHNHTQGVPLLMSTEAIKAPNTYFEIGVLVFKLYLYDNPNRLFKILNYDLPLFSKN